MLKAFICLSVASLIIANIFGCSQPNIPDEPIQVIVTDGSDETVTIEDQSESIIDDIIFLGESTTYHLKSRGVLKDGKNTKQVWSPKSGTLMLDASTSDCRIVYPETNEEISLSEALKRKQPKIMALTFGLNGAPSFITRGRDYFKFCYKKLLDTIKEVSPSTKIIINSCFPIAKNMDMSRYTVDAKTLNLYIDALNAWACELAKENGARFIDSASVLKDSEGYLDTRFQVEDGYHLNADAYKLILKYFKEELKNEEN